MQRSIEATGEVIVITKVHKGMGRHEGEICDLMQYKDCNNVTRLIEAPLLAK
ncbi:MAG: hypothetical protein PQJ49_12525 [Sphaerochaetaceae bacterium]|nr:hypothetical protein [Sphaerochaetaceae bacterium]